MYIRSSSCAHPRKRACFDPEKLALARFARAGDRPSWKFFNGPVYAFFMEDCLEAGKESFLAQLSSLLN